MTSIATRIAPPAIAGQASGSVTRKNAPAGPQPSIRAASSAVRLCVRNAVRAARYTYGYNTDDSTPITAA